MTNKKKADKKPARKPGRPAANDADRRSELIDSALQLFASTGIAATSFKSVASAVRVTSALVHYYFKSRDDLLQAVTEERVIPVLHAVWKPIYDETLDCRSLISRLAVNMVTATFCFPWFAPLWLREFSTSGSELHRHVQNQIGHRYPKLFAARVRLAQRRGEIHASFEPDALYSMLIGMVLMQNINVLGYADFKATRKKKMERDCQTRITRLLNTGLGV